jgi:hypothetical protein
MIGCCWTRNERFLWFGIEWNKRNCKHTSFPIDLYLYLYGVCVCVCVCVGGGTDVSAAKNIAKL